MKKTKFERLKMHLLHLMRELMHLFPKKKCSSSVKVIRDGNSEVNIVKKRAVELDNDHVPISSVGAVFQPHFPT